MKLVVVESSMIHAIGYDSATAELEAIFNSGGIYRYTNVPYQIYEELLAAESKGQYMLNHVIDVYPYYQLSRRRRRRRKKETLCPDTSS